MIVSIINSKYVFNFIYAISVNDYNIIIDNTGKGAGINNKV